MIHQNIVCCYLYVISKYGYPPPADDVLDHLQEMNSLGFQSVELEGIRKDHLMAMYDRRFDIQKQLRELDLNVPYFCTVLPGLASADPKARKQNLEWFARGCEIAALIGSNGVLDNAPLPPYRFPGDIPVVRHYEEDVLLTAYLPNLDWKQYWNALTDTFRRACDIAAEHGLTYQMHPCVGVLAATTDGFMNFFQSVQRRNLRFNLDTANQFALKDNLFLSLIRAKEHIDYIHLSDNRGSRVEHLAPEAGVIRWKLFFETLERIDYNGYIGLDIGGAESGVSDIDQAYIKAANWLQAQWNPQGS